MKKSACTALFVLATLFAPTIGAQDAASTPAPVAPASPQLLDHIFKQIERRERPSITPGMSAQASAAFANADFMTTRDQLRTLGVKAAPLAPRVAELAMKSSVNQSDLIYMLTGMTAQESGDPARVADMLARYRGETGSARLVELARIGKVRSPLVVPTLVDALNDDTAVIRLLAVIGLATAGATAPEAAAPALGRALGDKEKALRTAAANSLRILGARADNAVPALIDYLKTRDNVYAASAALVLMPLALVRPAKAELESILTDTRLTEFQKRDVGNMLIKMEMEPQ